MNKICFVATAEFAVNAFLLNHLQFLSKHYDVTLIVNTNNTDFLKERGLLVKVVSVPISRPIRILSDLWVLFKLMQLFRFNEFTVVHSLTPKAGFLSMFAAKLIGVPLRFHTFTGQVWANKTGIFRGLLKGVDKLTSMFATDLIVDSHSQLNFLINQNVIDPRKAIVFGKGSVSGVNLKKFRSSLDFKKEIRTELNIPFSSFVFVFLGRVNRDKGILDLLEAFRRLNDEHSYLLVVGPDEEGIFSDPNQFPTDLNKRLRVVGATQSPEKFLAASDVICLASYREGFGSSVIEASAMGLPSIVSRIYGLTDAVEEGVTGLMHSPHDVEGILACMKLFLEDSEFYRICQKRGIERVRQFFDADVISQMWLDFYQERVKKV